jgi:hypothetical protein
MAADLTEKEFSKHVNTKFRAQLAGGVQVELELDEVKGYPGHPGDQQGMERFSIFFKGPTEPVLPQQSYTLKHDQMGEFEIFLVPLSRNEKGSRYEAVFNYFKPKKDEQ